MANPYVSILITTFNRSALLKPTLVSINEQSYKDHETIVVDDGDDGGVTEELCRDFGARYIKVQRPQTGAFKNPCVPNNIGIKAALGEVLIIQNAECVHTGKEVINRLSDQANDHTAVFAAVIGLNQDGTPDRWYTHSTRRRPYFFCGAIGAKTMNLLGGFDEDYVDLGYDDNDMGDRLKAIGVRFVFDDEAVVQHWWHPPSLVHGFPTNEQLYLKKRKLMQEGKLSPVRNSTKDWARRP